MTIKFIDRATTGETKITTEGYLIATAKVARTGVQEYLARELGDIAAKDGFKPDDVVKVYRSANEVFAVDSLKTITRVPITIDHPDGQVTADSWKQLAVGEVGDAVKQDNEWLIVNPMVKDHAAVKAATSSHKQISMGYTAKIIKARDGVDADYEMIDIRYNHLALVPSARAGEEARIGDNAPWGAEPIFNKGQTAVKEGDKAMTLATIVLGDTAVQVAATDSAKVEQYKVNKEKQISDAQAAHAAAIAAKDQEIGKLTAELAEAKAAGNIDVDALVAQRSDLVAAVKAIDARIDVKGKTDAELRKAAVASKFGDALIKDASDDVITGMFIAACKTNPVKEVMRDAAPLNQDGTQFVDHRAAYLDSLNRVAK